MLADGFSRLALAELAVKEEGHGRSKIRFRDSDG